MAASLLSAAVAFALRAAFGRAMQQHAPALFLDRLAAAPPVRNRVLHVAAGVLLDTVISVLLDTVIGILLDTVIGVLLDTVISVLLDTVIGVLLDTVVGVLYIAVLAVLLLLLFASCVVVALAAIVVYHHRAWVSRTGERRLAVLSIVSLFLLTVAVVLMAVLFLATVDGEE